MHNFSTALGDFINTVLTRNVESLRYVPQAQSLLLSDLSFVDGRLVITEKAKDNILERDCRIYIGDREEIGFYSMLKELENKLQEYTKKIKGLEIPVLIGDNPLNTLDSFFDYDWDNAKLNVLPESIKWALKSKTEDELATQKIMDRLTVRASSQVSQQNIY
jgi:hypothetical protein